jgi:hypothetical protein
MAVLNESDRAEIFGDFLRTEPTALALTKAQIRAAVDAIDTWVDANAASLNTAIPQPARVTLTNAQKARLMAWVIRQRYVKVV